MKKIKKTLILFFSIVLLISLCFSNLTIYTEISAPNQYIDENEELTGLAVEVVRELQEIIGDTSEITVIPWARGYNALLTQPNILLFSTTRTEEREALGFKWVGPVVNAQYILYAKAGSDLVINSIEDAKKVGAIGTYIDDVREQYLMSLGFTNLDRSPDDSMNVRKLMANRIDLIVGSNTGIEPLLESEGYSIDDVVAKLVVREAYLYLAFSKETDDEIVRIWDNAFKLLQESNRFEEIYNKYLPGSKVPERVPYEYE